MGKLKICRLSANFVLQDTFLLTLIQYYGQADIPVFFIFFPFIFDKFQMHFLLHLDVRNMASYNSQRHEISRKDHNMSSRLQFRNTVPHPL